MPKAFSGVRDKLGTHNLLCLRHVMKGLRVR